MKDFERNYKSMLNKMQLSNEESKNIKLSILSCDKNRKVFRLKYALIIVSLFLLGTTTVVYGKEMINAFKGFFFETEKVEYPGTEDLVKYKVGHFTDITEIPDGKVFSDKDLNNKFYYNEIEKKLGIKILKSPMLDKKEFTVSKIGFTDKNLSKIEFAMKNDPVKIEKSGSTEELRYSFRIWTQYSTEEERNKYSSYIADGYYEMSTYHINSLNVDAYIFEPKLLNDLPDWQIECKCYPLEARIFFAYDGILYKIFITRVNHDDFYKILESFSY